jgi:PleD family two-component response regulator
LLTVGERKIRVNVTASVGVAEYRAGEPVFEFFERADQLMYERKAQDKAALLHGPPQPKALVG